MNPIFILHLFRQRWQRIITDLGLDLDDRALSDCNQTLSNVPDSENFALANNLPLARCTQRCPRHQLFSNRGTQIAYLDESKSVNCVRASDAANQIEVSVK